MGGSGAAFPCAFRVRPVVLDLPDELMTEISRC